MVTAFSAKDKCALLKFVTSCPRAPVLGFSTLQVFVFCFRDGFLIAEQLAPAPHIAHSEGSATLRIVLVTVPGVNRSCEHFPDGFDLHLLHFITLNAS